MYTYTLTAVPSHVTVQRLYIETDPDAFIYGRYAEQKRSLTFSFGEDSLPLQRQMTQDRASLKDGPLTLRRRLKGLGEGTILKWPLGHSFLNSNFAYEV